MVALILPKGETTFFDANGDPLGGGKVYFYIPETTTFKDTWQDEDQAILNTNPVILDAAGRGIIWGDGRYRQLVTDSLDNEIWDRIVSTPVSLTEAEIITILHDNECGPILYAGVSEIDTVGGGDANYQTIQFESCDAEFSSETGFVFKTIITFVAGVTNTNNNFNMRIKRLDDSYYNVLGYSVFKNSVTGPVELAPGNIFIDNWYQMGWDESVGVFILLNPTEPSIAIADNSITNAKLVSVTGPMFIGRDDLSLGPPEYLNDLEATAILVTFVGDTGSGGVKGLVPVPAPGDAAADKFLKADATWSAITVPDAAITNAKLANVPSASFKGRITGGTGVPEDLTATQATSMLNNFVGDSGSGGTKGLVPAPAAGDAAAGKFLKADGTFEAPSGSGAPSTAEYVVGALHAGLSAERVGTNTATISWDFGTAAQAKLNVNAASITNAMLVDVATTAEFLANTASQILTTDQVWAAGTEVGLTDAATIAVNMALFINANVTLAGNRTLGQPTNTKNGQAGCIRIIQDGTGSRTLAYHSDWKFAGGVDPTLSTAAGSQDLLFYQVLAANIIYATLIQAIA